MVRPQTTSDRLPRAGLDAGARRALVRALADAGALHSAIVGRFLRREAYADLADYFDAVEASWGHAVAEDLRRDVEAFVDQRVDDLVLDVESARRHAFDQYGSLAVLLAMPEGDFLTAVEIGATLTTDPMATAALPEYLNQICARRGAPYRVEGTGGKLTLNWHGDSTVYEEAIGPALGALDDARLADGPRREFSQARKELREGTPDTLKQAVAETCNAVESTMKVVLDTHGAARPARENAQDLFNALVSAGLAAKDTEELLLSAARFGNRRGRHGAGPVAHSVTPAEAQGVVAAAATAIVMLSDKLA